MWASLTRPAAAGCVRGGGCRPASGSGATGLSTRWSVRASGVVQDRRAFARLKTPGAKGRPPILILDLDETLARVCCQGVHLKRKLDHVDFKVPVTLGSGDKAQTFSCDVATRPGLSAFLEWIRAKRDKGDIEGPWLLTTATPVISKMLLKIIDPRGALFQMRVLTREFCVPTKMPGFYLKPLGRVPCEEYDDGCRRKVLVDNSPISCIQNPDSSILVRDWLGDDPLDNELDRVRILMDDVINAWVEDGRGSDFDFAAHISALQEGHDFFRERLPVLGKMVQEEPPRERVALRKKLGEIMEECSAIKQHVLKVPR